MNRDHLKPGARVVVHLPYGDTSEGEVVDSPVIKNNKAVIKVRHPDFDNCYPAEWIKPLLGIVR